MSVTFHHRLQYLDVLFEDAGGWRLFTYPLWLPRWDESRDER